MKYFNSRKKLKIAYNKEVDCGHLKQSMSGSSSQNRKLKASLRSASRSAYLINLLLLPMILYIFVFSTMAVQEGFPVLTQMLLHAQRLDWGILYVKGWQGDWKFILDWREAAYDTSSVRGNGWNAKTWMDKGEREVVLSCFGLSAVSGMVCFLCTAGPLLYLWTKGVEAEEEGGGLCINEE